MVNRPSPECSNWNREARTVLEEIELGNTQPDTFIQHAAAAPDDCKMDSETTEALDDLDVP
ncbi:MAG: hypothetical protein ACRDJV_15085 [Actinomycetota bacterium]